MRGDDVLPPSWGGLPSGKSHVVVAVCWDRKARSLGKICHQKRYSLIEPVSFRGVSRAIYNSSDRFAGTTEFCCGRTVIAGFASRPGNLRLLLCNQLRDSWLWRCDPPIEVADVRATREHHWRRLSGTFPAVGQM